MSTLKRMSTELPRSVFGGNPRQTFCVLFSPCGFDQSQPYTMVYPENGNRTGNDLFYGYAIDLIRLLAKEVGFKYEFYLTPGGKYGNKLPNNEWNGMIKQLLDRVRNITTCFLTFQRFINCRIALHTFPGREGE